MSVYVECPWLLDDGRNVRSVTISGRVDGEEVRGFTAEDSRGEPVRIPDDYMPDALTDLIATAREIWSTP